jgi:multicomponent Na+:H+ antiporter subunit F
MKTLALVVALVELALIGLLAIRLYRGPTVTDRIVALNTMSTQAGIAVLFIAAFLDRSIDADVALWLCSFSYLGGIVWARYLERGLL